MTVESLVALRDRREHVIARISECYASDVLEVDELERRLDLAHGARTVAELDALVADLVAPGTPGASAPSTALVAAPVTAIDDPSRAERKRTRVIMSSVERRGRWTVPRHFEARVFWGNMQLDFRDASLAQGVTTIDAHITMGNLEIILPPDLAVDVELSSTFASSVEERHRVSPEPDPARPLLRIVGAVWFGNLEITTRLPGESGRDARRRERRERKARRKALGPGSSKALPP